MGNVVMTPDFSLGTSKMFITSAETVIDPVNAGRRLPVAYYVHLQNIMEIEFTVSPIDIEQEIGGSVRFDVTRDIESKFQNEVYLPNGLTKINPAVQDNKFSDWPERVNDDTDAEDEDNTPNKGTSTRSTVQADSCISPQLSIMQNIKTMKTEITLATAGSQSG